jgi:hypothetical protein
MTTKGTRRLVAEWLVEIGGDEVNGVNPDLCKYDECVLNADLETALNMANYNDLNSEGTVREEEWSGEVWHTVERYSCDGERLFT